ncbi:hypothetical protein O3M35_004955 [Rhynocoris fuscipes]|uniref:Uncharacterized protein n=1 Tax=Rhynocoris fuscipes TaxID=488301 RepID=A0AAW1DK67_9HEMI
MTNNMPRMMPAKTLITINAKIVSINKKAAKNILSINPSRKAKASHKHTPIRIHIEATVPTAITAKCNIAVLKDAYLRHKQNL